MSPEGCQAFLFPYLPQTQSSLFPLKFCLMLVIKLILEKVVVSSDQPKQSEAVGKR